MNGEDLSRQTSQSFAFSCLENMLKDRLPKLAFGNSQMAFRARKRSSELSKNGPLVPRVKFNRNTRFKNKFYSLTHAHAHSMSKWQIRKRVLFTSVFPQPTFRFKFRRVFKVLFRNAHAIWVKNNVTLRKENIGMSEKGNE